MTDGMVYPQVRDEPILLSYGISEDESVYEAITNAFSSIEFDPFDAETTIADWTDDCPVDSQEGDATSDCRVTTTIWDHPIVLTDEDLRIFEKE